MKIDAIISLITLIFSIILGLSVFAITRRQIVRQIYVVAVIFLLIIEFSIFMIFLKNDVDHTIFWGKIITSSFCLLLPTLSIVGLIFARKNYPELLRRRIWYLSLTFGVSLVFLYSGWKIDLLGVSLTFPKVLFLITNSGKYLLVFSLLITTAILINLENTLHSAKTVTRKESKGPVYVLIGAFLFGVYAFSQMLLFSRISQQLVITSMGAILVINLFLLFYIIKNGLNQLQVQIGREAVYSSVMILIVGSYLLIIGIVGKIVQVAGGDVNLFLSFLAAFLVFCLLLSTLVSKSLKQRIKLFVDRTFYKDRYDYREQWGKFSESLSAVVNLDEMLSSIIENISSIFMVSTVAIFLKDENTGDFVLKKTKNLTNVDNIKFSGRSDFIDWFYRFAEATGVDTLLEQDKKIGLNAQEKENLKKLHAAVCVPMIIRGKFIGILTLGEKTTTGKYSSEDFELLETLANQSSVTIQNAKLNEDLLVSREMESFHKLSSFVLHDMKNAASMLSMVVKNAENNIDNQEFQKDMLVTISNAVTRIKSLISKITSFPDKLELKRQNVQINDLLEQVLKDTKVKEFNNIIVEENFEKLPVLAIDTDMFQKVIENLLINALEAMPQGGKLRISTKLHNHQHHDDLTENSEITPDGLAEIEVVDSGTGMSQDFMRHHLFKPFQTTKKKGLGIGLYQCKEIIIAHQGTIEVNSKVNEGTSFKIFLPVPNSNKSNLNII